MARIPKGFRKNLNIVNQKFGPERRQEILDNIANNGTFLPRGITYEDIDTEFIRFVNEDLEINIDGAKVPVIFLTLQTWAEFSRTWQVSDEFGDVKMPFITIVRLPNPQVGKNQAGLWNIPGRRTYTYMKVPSWDGNRVGVDMYKIPQPTAIDFTYEVRLFCNKMSDLNTLNKKVHQAFRSRQFYVYVNGNPMPIFNESIGDESNISDFENKRFYVQPYEMRFEAYILDEDEFVVTPAINRIFLSTEADEGIIKPKVIVKNSMPKGLACYSFEFEANGGLSMSFLADYKINFTHISDILNLTNIIIKINGIEKLNGIELVNSFVVNNGDYIYVKIIKGQNNQLASFNLNGKLL